MLPGALIRIMIIYVVHIFTLMADNDVIVPRLIVDVTVADKGNTDSGLLRVGHSYLTAYFQAEIASQFLWRAGSNRVHLGRHHCRTHCLQQNILVILEIVMGTYVLLR